MAREHIPGLALGVYRRGRILKAQGYGLANVELNVPVKAGSILQSGSISKQFTATALMMLVADESACPERRQSFAEFDQLCLSLGRRFVGLVVGCARLFEQPGKTVLLITPQPLAHRRYGGGEVPRGGLDAPLLGAPNQAQAMVVGVFHLTH